MSAELNNVIVYGGGASVGTELKFDDEYLYYMKIYFGAYAADLQKGVDKYIEIMHNIRENAIIAGETAKALDDFISYADKLKEIINESGADAKTFCENFVTEVNEKDALFY